MDLQRGVVAEPVGVADLRPERGELLERPLLGLVGHPVEVGDRAAVGLEQVGHELVHLLLGARREVPLDVLPADGLADGALHERHPTLPAGPQLGGAAEGPAVEVEVGLDEVVGEVRRGGAQHPDQQPRPPGLQRHLVQRDREVREVGRLPDTGLGERRLVAAQVAHPGVPVVRRAQLPELGDGREVVGLLDVAGLGALPVAGGEPGLDLEDGGRGVGGRGVVGEAEHRGQVGDVLLPDLGELVVAVVRLVGQPEPALEQVDQVAVGVLRVGVDVGAEQPGPADPLELTEERREVADVAQPVDRVEDRPDRPGAAVGDRLGVHEGGEEVADPAGVVVEGVRVGVGEATR